MYKKIEEELILEIQEKRTDRRVASERLTRARGAEGLQARGSLMSIFSTPADVFAEFLVDCPEYVDLPTFGSNASNAIPGSVMLSRANEMQERVEGRGGGGGGGGAGPRVEPNAPLLGAALEDVLRFKALWGSRMLAVTLLMVDHPSLGRVALVQPLLVAAAMQRVHNWGHEVDPVFEVLLQAGASPNGRNSLSMTALMLVATSLIGQLENHTECGIGGGGGGGEALAGEVAKAAGVAAATARLLLAAGADAGAEMRGFGADKWDASSRAASLLPGPIRSARHVLHLERYTAHEAFEVMRRMMDEQIRAAGPDAVRHMDEFAALLLPPPAPSPPAGGTSAVPVLIERPNDDGANKPADLSVEGQQQLLQQQEEEEQQQQRPDQGGDGGAVDGDPGAGPVSSEAEGGNGGGGEDGGGGGGGAGPAGRAASAAAAADGVAESIGDQVPPSQAQQQQQQQQQQQHPEEERQRVCTPQRPARDISWPWVQAMSNIAWAVSQVTMAHTAASRRAFLRRLCLESPFRLPPMSVVSVEQLRREGCIPRYSTKQDPSTVRFQPLPVDELPASAVVVFVSHRWLGRGCPDDDHGTKLRQVLAVSDHVAAHRGVPLESVHLWLDYAVVDQDDPMPGVQALPVYIACCEEFVYIRHPEYWQRAWCLTEQFMHWKLATSDVKHVLTSSPTGARAGAGLALTTESARERPPDPTYGKLAVEADRVALATMTSILPYDVS